MGAKIIKGYDLEAKPLFGAGPDGLWQVYLAKKDDSSKQPATAFVLSKSYIDSKKKVAKGSDLYSFLKREAQQLVKLRHPMILSMIDPLVENKDNTCGFVTEPVVGNLAYLIEQENWMELCGSELELKIHLLELFDAVSFLHNDARTVHNSLNPASVYLTAEGKWKLGGFAFSCGLGGSSGPVDAHHIDINAAPNVWVLPPTNYMAPDMIKGSVKVSTATDIYSLGCLIFSLFSCLKNKKMEEFIGKTSVGLLPSVGEELKNERLVQKKLEVIPVHFRDSVAKMLNIDPDSRPPISAIAQSPYFYDPFIQVVKNIGKLKELEVNQQQVFLNSLCKIITRFERKVIVNKLVPALNELLTFNPQLSPPIIQVFIILMKQPESYTKADVLQLFWPKIKTLCMGKEMPAKTLYLLILHISLFIQFLAKDDLQNVFLPLLYKCYECGVPKIQALAIRKTEILFSSFDSIFIKAQILPRLFALCIDQAKENRKWALLVILKKSDSLDRKTVSEQLMAVIDKVRKLENDAEINLIVLKIFQAVAPSLGTDQIANRLLCSMIPMLLDINLNKSEFVQYFATIESLLKRIQEERMSAYVAAGSTGQDVEISEANTDEADEASLLPVLDTTGANEGVFDFLSMFGGGQTAPSTQAAQAQAQKSDYNFSNFSVDQTIGASKAPGAQANPIMSNSFTDFSKQFQPESVSSPTKPQNQSLGMGYGGTQGLGLGKGPEATQGQRGASKNEFEMLDNLIGGESPAQMKPPPLKFGGKTGGLKPPPRAEPLSGPNLNSNMLGGASSSAGNDQNLMDLLGGTQPKQPFPKPISTNPQNQFKPAPTLNTRASGISTGFDSNQGFGKTNMPGGADSLLNIGSIPSGNGSQIEAAFSGIDMDFGAPPTSSLSGQNIIGSSDPFSIGLSPQAPKPMGTVNNTNQLQMSYQSSHQGKIETDWGLENEFADYLQEKKHTGKSPMTIQPKGLGFGQMAGAGSGSQPSGSSGMFNNMKTVKKLDAKPAFGAKPAQANKNIDLDSFFDNI